MSKRVKQKRKQPKHINGWPIKNIRCFEQFNDAIFFMRDPDGDLQEGIGIGVKRSRWPDAEVENPHKLWNGIEEGESFTRLGIQATAIPTQEQLDTIDWWMDREQYQRLVRENGCTPWEAVFINEENIDMAEHELDY